MNNEAMRPMLFWVGLVLIFIGIVAAWLYIIGPHIWVFGPDRHVKHGLAAIGVAVAGAVIASFFRPRSSSMSPTASRYNR